MFKLSLGPRTISAATALPCLDHVSELQGISTTPAADEGVYEDAISLNQLIAVGRKRGIHVRLRSLSWPRLIIAVAAGPVLLLLNNGNVIVALKNGQAGAEDIIVSDPLYQSGKPFFLPRTALKQAWSGDTLTVKPLPTRAEQAVTWLIWVLSTCGMIAGAFFLLRALREAVGY